MKIAIGNDHTGVEMKQLLVSHIINKYGYEVINVGTDTAESVDYPVYGRKVAQLVADNKANKGIVICGTGIGMSISANKVKGIRAALCKDQEAAEMTRKHNDSNVLALGARTTSLDEAIKIADVWLTTEFEGGRHQRRVEMLEN
ncbi:MAG: ribose 5-phosphate isomerase B [Candidatus Riflemargulisbacteria bacterium]